MGGLQMNERIKRLAVQAKLRAPIMLQHWGKIDALTDSEQEELQNIEKFAELIVLECARVSEQTGALNQADFEGEMIAAAVKEHFGVEQ
jgi:hypothetical protein